ncbi:MAG TPA: WG repeat-containing protein [Mobilitalea sp.]|nr:WG repeat-containing protein [Mobilitalea sp.]
MLMIGEHDKMKKSMVWVLVLALISVTIFGFILFAGKKSNNESILYPVQVDGKWGYINKSGKLVIEPTYAMAEDFYDGVAIVQIKDDTAGSSDEEANNVKYGAINTAGKMVVDPNFSYISKFNEGIAGAIIENKDTYAFEYYILDKTGKILYTLPSDMEIVSMLFNGSDMQTQSEGLILVRNANSEMYGFIDRNGKLVIPCEYYEGYNFTNGLALVKKDMNYQYIDKTGKVVIDASKYKFCRTFSEGLAAVAVQKDEQSAIEFGYIDTKGNMKIEPQFAKAYSFSEGLAKVCTGESINQYSIGYIDGAGAYAIEPNLTDNADETLFSEGFVPVDDGTGGYMNQKGKLVINPVVQKDEGNFIKHNTAGEFRNGIAKVSLSDGSIGYIDTTGKYIWNPSK